LAANRVACAILFACYAVTEVRAQRVAAFAPGSFDIYKRPYTNATTVKAFVIARLGLFTCGVETWRQSSPSSAKVLSRSWGRPFFPILSGSAGLVQAANRAHSGADERRKSGFE